MSPSPTPLIPTGVMYAGHQVQTMDESDALRLCGDWLEGGQRSASCVCGKANQVMRLEGTLKDTATLTHAHGHFDIDGPT